MQDAGDFAFFKPAADEDQPGRVVFRGPGRQPCGRIQRVLHRVDRARAGLAGGADNNNDSNDKDKDKDKEGMVATSVQA